LARGLFFGPCGGNPDDRVAALLTNLFDAMMTTFCWAQEVQGEPA
jgi:hypothetical protein